MNFFEKMLTLPFSVFFDLDHHRYYTNGAWTNVADTKGEFSINEANNDTSSGFKDYSKTNIQVEGVDEADIIKTDGDYIYSISGNNVVITNVENPDNVVIESTISNEAVPMDLLLYKDNLVVVLSADSNTGHRKNTLINIYSISDKKKPRKLKSFELYQEYNTTRSIDGKLYVFSNGWLRKDGDKVLREYKEDYDTHEIPFKDIKYLKNSPTDIQTLIAEVDLNNPSKDVRVSAYLIDIANAYISKNSIYLLDDDYYTDKIKISSLFSLKGVIGVIEEINDYDYQSRTKIYKFNMDKKKGVTYKTSTTVEGNTINQYSLDEKDNNLRVALYEDDGTRVVVLNDNLKLLGETSKVAKGERMYASRFMGDKAYLVTYKNTDPLFVIDLADSKNPKVLGELKIPGYSTYLHPYDETHLIGIGMDSDEVINRDINGKVISTWSTITSMKMSLFDVSDLENPKEIDNTKIGDDRTVSAILSNPKALLFSKEKNLLAIPVNDYQSDFQTSVNGVDEEEDFTTFMNENRTGEGYLVYNVDLNGFKLKGQIIHSNTSQDKYYYYSYDSKLLRGVYINNNLFTVSEDMIKVNALDDLKEISSININDKGVN